MSALGANLREVRERLGLTQEEVAHRSGVHATEVSRMEAGKPDPQVSTLERLAKAVEVKPGQLLDGLPPARAQPTAPRNSSKTPT